MILLNVIYSWHLASTGGGDLAHVFICLTPTRVLSLWCWVRIVVAVHFQCHRLAGLSSEGHCGHVASAVHWPDSDPILPWDWEERDVLNVSNPYLHKT